MDKQDLNNLSLGIAAGYTAKIASATALGKARVAINKKCTENVWKFAPLFTQSLIDDVFEKSGLKEKGISIVHMDKDNKNTVLRDMFCRKDSDSKIGQAGNYFKRVRNRKRNKNFQKSMSYVAEGYNSCFIYKKSAILINAKKLGVVVFHEMGHALNRNKPLRKLLVKYKTPVLQICPPLILAVGLAKNKKDKSEAPKNILDKTTDFVKNNAGELSALCYVPTITEEAIASINAIKIAKGVLDKTRLKKMCKYNAFAFSTYLAGAALSGLTTAGAVYIRDKIAQPKSAKV